jgi:general secretion pathway protein J
VHWWLENDQLWRGYYPVLDRTAGTEPIETLILDDVTRFEVRFLPAVGMIESDRDDVIDRRNWQENWIADLSQPGVPPTPPAAVEVVLDISGLGEVRRLYVLPGH